MLEGKKVLIGVCGGIAAYKTCELVSGLRQRGAEVRVILTRGATNFIHPLTMETLSGHPVYLDQWSGELPHITLARWAQVLVVAPATAHTIARLAAGLADDLLTSCALATRAPLLVCPAMNTRMYTHSATRANLGRLCELGYHVLSPASGHLACGEEGPGRLAGVEEILAAVERLLEPGESSLAGLRVLVTAGPTREPLDPVRFLTNRSSGKMGYAVAAEAARRGAEVILVSGPTALSPPSGVQVLWVETAEEMRRRVLDNFAACRVVVMVAAVADYRPVSFSPHKLKKTGEPLQLWLEPNPDILAELGRQKKPDQVLVGFAAETEDLLVQARAKLQAKNLDLVVANDVTGPGAGFEVDTNRVALLFRERPPLELPALPKPEVARRLWEQVVELLELKSQGDEGFEA